MCPDHGKWDYKISHPASAGRKRKRMYSIDSYSADLPFSGYEQDRLSGECEMSDQRLVDEVGISFGVWQVTPGVFRSHWPSWEAFTILSGKGTLEDDQGQVHELVPGALVVIPPGSTGVWHIEETLRKTYMYAVGGGGRPGIPEGFQKVS